MNWRDVRHLPQAHRHIQTSIAGKRDLCICTVCYLTEEMEQDGKTRYGVLLSMARRHFYKHKLWTGIELAHTAEAREVPLFPEAI